MRMTDTKTRSQSRTKKVSAKSQKLNEKKFVRAFNRAIENQGLSKEPNTPLEYQDYLGLISTFVF